MSYVLPFEKPIVELEKKWGVPPTDYAKRMHEAAKKGS